MLETQLNPIFGLTFMQIFEFTVIFAIIISISGLIFTGYHRRIQYNIASAKILLDRLNRLEQKDFRITSDFLDGIDPPKNIQWNQRQEIIKFLNYFEDLGLFVDQEIVKSEHIIQMHRDTIRVIKENQHAQKIIQEYQKKDKDYYYVFLSKLFKKI